jgi:hypothetical protein
MEGGRGARKGRRRDKSDVGVMGWMDGRMKAKVEG